jgi:FtsH-binding integral membrane protein
MKVAMRIAFGLGVFIAVASSVYYVSSEEWRGSVMLLVLALSSLYLGLVFRGALRRASVPATKEAMADEEISEAHVGPTIWPFVISLAALLVVVATVVAAWVMIPGLILLLAAGIGWIVDIRRQWHPSELHAAPAAAGDVSALEGDQQPDEADRE